MITENQPKALPAGTSSGLEKKQTGMVIALIGGAVILIALLAVGIFFLAKNPQAASNVRDIFIILMALVLIVIGLALIILIIQLSILINLLQNEIKPILNSTNETIDTLRGTASFLSANLVEPVIKLNEYLAGVKKLIDLLRIK